MPKEENKHNLLACIARLSKAMARREIAIQKQPAVAKGIVSQLSDEVMAATVELDEALRERGIQ